MPPLEGPVASCAWPGCGFRTPDVQARKAGDRLLMEHYAARQLVEHYESVHAKRRLD